MEETTLTARAWVYAGIAVIGIIAPWYYNLQFMASGADLLDATAFLSAAMANPGAASLTVDLLIGCTAFFVWLFPEAKRLGMRNAWVYLVLTFGVAFAFSFPLFLCMRERRLAELAAQAG